MQGLVVHFKGFSPNTDTLEFFDHLLDHVHDESINAGTARVNVARIKKSFEAIVEMATPKGRLVGRAVGTDAHEAGRKAVHKLRRQVERRKAQWMIRHG